MDDTANLKKKEDPCRFNPLGLKCMYPGVLKGPAIGLQCETSSNGSEYRKLFLMRHGERVNFTFGKWVPYCFDESSQYIRKDLNLPETIPGRSLGPMGYDKDSPLTNLGIFQATTTGRALSNKKLDIAHAYCSPSYRCVQTCDALLKGWNKRDQIKIKIEPGLFEWPGFYIEKVLPDWMTTEELVTAGYNIDLDYEPFFSESRLKETAVNETCEEFYVRNSAVAKGALKAHPAGNVLLVGHATTLEACSKELIGKKPREVAELIKAIRVPYCGLVQLVPEGDKWKITEPPIPPLTHSGNERFDYKILLD